MNSTFVGVAGWTIPSSCRERCAGEDSHLARYARQLSCVEINSSFYREHKAQTYARWAANVPGGFRFSVKLSKFFTQEQKLAESGKLLKGVLEGPAALGEKWGVLLVQLPPSLEFNAQKALKFIKKIHQYVPRVKIAWEPRHKSWGEDEALRLLADYGVSKVLADPERCVIKREQRPPVENKLRYYRLHGTPVTYRSSYPHASLLRLANKIIHPLSPTEETWIVFDNTAFGFATENALDVKARLERTFKSPSPVHAPF